MRSSDTARALMEVWSLKSGEGVRTGFRRGSGECEGVLRWSNCPARPAECPEGMCSTLTCETYYKDHHPQCHHQKTIKSCIL